VETAVKIAHAQPCVERDLAAAGVRQRRSETATCGSNEAQDGLRHGAWSAPEVISRHSVTNDSGTYRERLSSLLC